MQKQKLAISCFALAAIVAIALGRVPAAAQQSGAITVFVAKKIVTMNPSWPVGTAVSVHQALRMVTIEAVFAHGIEDKVGSIAPGKYADFAVLDQDPYAVAKEKIRDIKIWGTVLGVKVFPASEIRPQ